MLLRIHHIFPRLIPNEVDLPTKFVGHITIGGQDYFISISTPFYPKSKGIKLTGDVKLLELLQYYQIKLKKDNDADTVLDFLERLYHLNTLVDDNSNQMINDINQADILSMHLSQLNKIGWQNVSHTSEDFLQFTFEFKDVKARIHKLHIQFPSLNHSPVIETELPINVQFLWKPDEILYDIYEQWKETVYSLQPFWDIMDEIDESLVVLDPPEPTKKHTTRRILLENRVNVQLTINPKEPFACPTCQLMGPSELVTPLNSKICEKNMFWSITYDYLSSLEELFELALIKKTSSMDDSNASAVTDIDCAVCYCLHLNDQLPDVMCDYCQKKFHLECLSDWLRSLSNSRLTIRFIHGDCPICSKSISCVVK